MGNFPIKYKIVNCNDKTGVIAANHNKKELLVSDDIKLQKTDDGKLSATFPKCSQKADIGCSLKISDPSCFNHCIQKDGVYQLSGSNVTFNGTNNDDTLILNGVNNSKINMNDGNDTVLYRENKISNNDINLGNGNNNFTASAKTDADRALINNKISSGKGEDYLHLRNAIGNTVNTGDGKDFVEIEGASQSKYPNYFQNNIIDTGKGNDNVNILGNFEKFKNNEFYLGKGSDKFSAEINPNNDVKTETEYNEKIPEYTTSVSDNKIFATDGKKGFFEKNEFESKTYSANQLNEYISTKACSDGFQNLKSKPVPRNQEVKVVKDEPIKSSNKLTREYYSKRYAINSMGAMLFNDAKMQEAAFKALDDYVNSMQK